MRYIRASYSKYRKIYNLMFFIISVGITLGLIISFCLDKTLINSIYEYFIEHINNYNSNILSNILYPIIVYLCMFLLSLTILGVFMPFLGLFIENMSIGLIIGVILQNTGLKGLLFGIIYFVITKFLYLVVILYLVINLYKFVKELIKSLMNKNNNSIYNIYSRILLKLLFCILVISIYNVLGIFIIPRLIKLFIFLI